METVQIKIDTCPDNNFNFPKTSRTRKVSFDHGRQVNYMDINGNLGQRILSRRKSSCDASGLLSSLPVRKNSITICEPVADIPDWQKSLIKQIETLVVNSKQSTNVTSDLDNELQVINEGVVPQCVPSEKPRTRRKSFMHTGNQSNHHLHLHPKRKVSHGHIGHEHLSHLAPPGHGHTLHAGANNRRRKSYANIEHHVARSQRSGSVGNIKEALPFRGRLNSVSLHGNLAIPLIRQRRKSTVKQPTFTVSKITSVQRKSYNIYRRRRRKELRHVELVVPPSINIENSDEDCDNDDKTEQDESVTGVTDPVNEDSDNGDKTEQDESVTGVTDSLDVTNQDENSNTLDVTKDTGDCNLSVDESVPVARRKCSIQMRYWEISRKLRQRRRDKKRDSKMIDNDNDIDSADTELTGEELQ